MLKVKDSRAADIEIGAASNAQPECSRIIDPQRFRSIMRTFVNGVTVITTSRDGHIHGMTATAFSSVSADPPAVLVVQVELSKRFAGKLESPFDGVDYELSEHGVPMLLGVLAALECETLDELDVGTHTIFVGRVLDGARSETTPLVYHDGSYMSVTSENVPSGQ
jgi:flavin reductase